MFMPDSLKGAGGILLILLANAGPALPGAAADPLTLEIANDAGGTIACEAALAHWFSMRLGAIGDGRTLRLRLHRRSDDGTVSVATARSETAPVERIWCGRAGRAWATSATIPLPRAAGRVVATSSVACTADAGGSDRIICRPGPSQ